MLLPSNPLVNHKPGLETIDASKIQVIFCDIDGTLLDTKSHLHFENVQAVLRIKDRIPFYLISGRSPQGMEATYDRLQLRTPLLSLNGTLIVTREGQIQQSLLVSKAFVRRLYKAIQNHFPDVSMNLFTQDTWWTTPLVNPILEHEKAITGLTPKIFLGVTSLNKQTVYKILLLGDKNRLEGMLPLLKVMGTGMTIIHNYDQYIEIYSEVASKGTAVETTLKTLGIAPENALCIGDTLIDLPMFAACGYSIAMANAHPEVLQAATHVTATNDAFGVKQVLDLL